MLLIDKSKKEQVSYICRYKTKVEIANMFVELIALTGNYIKERDYEN